MRINKSAYPYHRHKIRIISIMINIQESRQEFQKVIEHFKKELSQFRTGRATPALVDDIKVEAYGSQMEMKAVGSIQVSDPKTLTIEPWDKNLLKDIEKAIVAANIGINPVNDGKVLRLVMPQLTEETRKDLIKVMGKKLEEARVGVRRARDEVKEKILAEEKEKKITEDERYRAQDALDKLSAEFNEIIKKMGEEKEKEIMTV